MRLICVAEGRIRHGVLAQLQLRRKRETSLRRAACKGQQDWVRAFMASAAPAATIAAGASGGHGQDPAAEACPGRSAVAEDTLPTQGRGHDSDGAVAAAASRRAEADQKPEKQTAPGAAAAGAGSEGAAAAACYVRFEAHDFTHDTAFQQVRLFTNACLDVCWCHSSKSHLARPPSRAPFLTQGLAHLGDVRSSDALLHAKLFYYDRHAWGQLQRCAFTCFSSFRC